jgi:hypothetical protein
MQEGVKEEGRWEREEKGRGERGKERVPGVATFM